MKRYLDLLQWSVHIMIADGKYCDGLLIVPLENNAVMIVDGAAQKSLQSACELANVE